MASSDPSDTYPSIRNSTEVSRLHIQHDLVTATFNGLILCPFDRTRPNLRILDIGTGDGHWLSEVRKQLSHPDSATLVGTDIAPYPGATENIVIHNFKTPFPPEWSGSFDLVQLRGVLANVSPGGDAVELLRRVLPLVKPDGWIQVLDGTMPNGEVKGDGKASVRFFTMFGNWHNKQGLRNDKGYMVGEYLKATGGGQLEDLGSVHKDMLLGKGSAQEEKSFVWLEMMLGAAKVLVQEGTLSAEEMQELEGAVLEEAKNEGVPFRWYAAWGRKAAA